MVISVRTDFFYTQRTTRNRENIQQNAKVTIYEKLKNTNGKNKRKVSHDIHKYISEKTQKNRGRGLKNSILSQKRKCVKQKKEH